MSPAEAANRINEVQANIDRWGRELDYFEGILSSYSTMLDEATAALADCEEDCQPPTPTPPTEDPTPTPPTEDPTPTPTDETQLCGNGICEGGEETTCRIDCTNRIVCGDGYCESEEQANCPEDCGIVS